MKTNLSDRVFNIFNIAFLALVGLVTLFPLYYVFAVSFTHPTEYLTKGGLVLFPEHWTLLSYRYLLSSRAFINSMGISTFLSIVGTAISLVVTSSFAYTLSRKRMPGRRALMLLVLMTTLFQAGIMPNYLLIRNLGLINNLWSLILPVLTSGWYILLMKGFFDSIPVSLEEAAIIDGCNDVGVWFRIILPLSLPSLAAFSLFFAVAYWNTYFNAILYINDFKKWPLQMLLQNMLIDSSTGASGEVAQQISAEQKVPTETLKMAAVVIATVPILMVYPFLQKHFAKGALVGSVKG